MNNAIFIFGAKYLYLLIVAIVFIWFLFQTNLKKKDILIFASICFLLNIVLAKIASQLYYNPRPFVVGNFTPLIHHIADNGFPSHHALLVSVIAGIVFIFNRGVGLVLGILALYVGFSRVYVGVHHGIDILASILISASSVFLVYLLREFLRNRKMRRN